MLIIFSYKSNLVNIYITYICSIYTFTNTLQYTFTTTFNIYLIFQLFISSCYMLFQMVRRGGVTIQQLVNGLERRVAFNLPLIDVETLKSTKHISLKERTKLILQYDTLEVPLNAFVKFKSHKIKRKVVKGVEKKCAIFAGFQLFNMFPGNLAHVAFFEGIVEYMGEYLYLQIYLH